MTQLTCAACDCALGSEPIKVTIGGNVVEVCCEDCAEDIRAARASLEKQRG